MDMDQTTAKEQLGFLAARLGADGWYARVTAPDGVPTGVHVVNPAVAALEDDIVVRRDASGQLWFYFRFGTPVAPATELDTAAARIYHVLGASTG